MSVLPTTPGLQAKFDNDINDDLLHLLTEGWDNPLKTTTITDSKWTRDYLSKLTSLPLDELLREPFELSQQQAKAKRDAQQLAFRNYPSFLHAQTCRHEAEETLDGLDVHLGEFLASVPDLQQACEEFEISAKQLKQERAKITSVLEHQNVLTDLLEIPQLMETCVWNGYYSEAMDLASHVRLLQVRYPLSVIKSIQQQVQASTDLMLVQLISHLRKPIRLAAAMNVMGFLRRMDVFESETELRMVFLRCRHDFLTSRLDRVKRSETLSEDTAKKSSDAFEYLKRFIDVMREQTFEIGTQYISIFSSTTTGEQGTLLSDYMVHITGHIKTALDTYLPMIEDTSALASLLTQLQYCGMSLGRIGLDFRNVFVHSFEQAVQPMILGWIDASTDDFVKLIVKSTEELLAPSTWMSSKTTSSQNNMDVQRKNVFQPPMLLVGYPSLAIFTNGILSAFNALRLLPAISLFSPIQNHLEACFLEIGNALKQYSDQAASHIPDEVIYLQSFTAAYVRCCVPYLKSCLVDGIYGGALSFGDAQDHQEDLDLLLVDYLPVVKKEDDDTVLEKEEEEIKEEKEKDHVDNEDSIIDSNITEYGKLEDLESTIQEEEQEESKQEELNEEEKKDEKNDSLKPNEEVDSVEESTMADKVDYKAEEPEIEESVAQEETAVESPPLTVEPNSQEPDVKETIVEQAPVVEKESVAEEEPIKEEEEEAVVVDDIQKQKKEAPAVENDDNTTSKENTTTSTVIDGQLDDSVAKQPDAKQPEENEEAVTEEKETTKNHAEKLPKEEIADENTQQIIEQLPQTETSIVDDHQGDKEKEDEEDQEEEEKVSTTTAEKKPQAQQQQQKKSKKHKKKGKR